MDEQRRKIQEDLRGLISGDVRCDDVFIQLYSSDASIHQLRPLGVVCPRTVEDLQAIVTYSLENKLTLHSRGSGTGLAGESLGNGLIVDFSKHFRRIIDTSEDRVRVQPGVILSDLNAHLRSTGRCFAPDPAMANVTTLGSVVSINGSGSHSLRYGAASSYVKSMEVVLSDGSVMELGKESIPKGPSSINDSRKRQLIADVSNAISKYEHIIPQEEPKVRFNRCGYNVFDTLSSTHLDVAKLLAGSEGTLGFFTELTIGTMPFLKHRNVAIFFFDRVDSAAKTAVEILSLDPSSADLLDRRMLSLARESEERYEELIPDAAEAALIVEQEGSDSIEARERISQTIDKIRRANQLAFAYKVADNNEENDMFWDLSRKVIPRLYRLKGNMRPLPYIEDIAVPTDVLPEFITSVQNVLKEHQVTASMLSHAGHGQLHIRPFLDLNNTADINKLKTISDEIYEKVIDVKGTISGEHGDGISRTHFVRKQYPKLYPLFQEIKKIFDPHNIFNPGKIVSEHSNSLANLRYVTPLSAIQVGELPAEAEPEQLIPLQLSWNLEEISHEARACNGCGACRTFSEEQRMCPIFRFSPAEEASPRAKANLMRGIITGDLPFETMHSPEFKDVVDLCVNCKMCRSECPASVDIPKLMMEARASYVESNGLKFGDFLLSRLQTLSFIGSLFAPITNWMIQNRQSRWLLEKLTGIAQGRSLPKFSNRNFMRWANRRKLTRPTRRRGLKVAYFVDTFANYHDPQLGEAVVRLLEHHGIAVYVPPDQQSSGMPLVSAGAIDKARKIAEYNTGMLADIVRQGYSIITSEPASLICLKEEYPNLVESVEEAELVAENSFDICQYLWDLHLDGQLDLKLRSIPISLAYHEPCHVRSLNYGMPSTQLLNLIPDLHLRTDDHGCSGMAGTFGLKRENYRDSLRAGWDLIDSLKDPKIVAGTTECSACKMQMEHGSSKITIHPLKILAHSYGYLPGLLDQIRPTEKKTINA